MKKRQFLLILLASGLVIALGIGFWQASLVLFINTLFVIGIIFVVIGAWLYILDQGFGRIIAIGFKKLRRHLPGFGRIQDSDEVFHDQIDDTQLYQTRQSRHTATFISGGAILVIISYLSLLLI